MASLQNLSFEQGPIRPPSEAQSLLLRFTRNCSWNQCLFCPVYKRRTFSRRGVEEVKADIDTVAQVIEEVKNVSGRLGFDGRTTENTVRYFFDQNLSQSVLSVVAWMYYQTGAVFIQDANNLILKTDRLVEMLEYLNRKVEGISRITSYARSQTAARKTQEEMNRIRQAGLDRIHVGMESGSDPVLKMMKKGVTGAGHIKGGLKIKAAGIELSEYFMPGLGGRALWRRHAEDSARVLNEINPDFIRLRTLRVPSRIPLHQKVLSGEFELQTDDEVVEEIRVFIERLDGITSFLASDHMMNMLQDVEGYFPRDKEFMLGLIDRYLDLSPEDRLHYRLGRRMGLYHGVADMARADLYGQVESALAKMKQQYPDGLEPVMTELANRSV